MELKLNPILHHDRKMSYAKEGMIIPDDMLDCSAGYNPYGPPPAALAALKGLTPRMIAEYPHGEGLKDAICAFWQGQAKLCRDNIVLTDASMSAIYIVNSAFGLPGASFLAPAPQFSDYTAHARFMNMAYRPLPLPKQNAYRFDPDEFISHIDSSLSIIYIDNPNNPTGQAVELSALRRIAQKAADCGVCLLLDEAYGDFMAKDRSGITLIADFPNVVVLRTFSKGLGLAGLRAGYIAASAELCADLNKLANPYMVSQPARLAAAASLTEDAFLVECCREIALGKARLREALSPRLEMAHTLDTCPICLLSHEDPSFDLAAAFFSRGVLTYSGRDFDTLGQNSVRLRMPRAADCGRLFYAAAHI